ncbi:MAG: DUF72 domain-containing protein [Thermoproteota archaeon]
MVSIKVGCCGFPVSMRKYFSEFTLVEIQSTFYKLPRVKTAERWRSEAPEGFEFTMKAWQAITHPPDSLTWKRTGFKKEELKSFGNFNPSRKTLDAWKMIVEIARSLGSSIIVLQTPPSFNPSPKNLDNMNKFFEKIDRKGLRIAWEPRGEWLEKRELTMNMLRNHNLIHVVDPFWDRPLTRGTYYFRLHGLGKRYNYKYEYTEDDLKKLRRIIEGLEDAEEVYVLFNNVKMYDSARLSTKIL